MRRREFISLIGGTAAWPFAARAQQAGKPPTIGYLAANAEAADRPRRNAFARRLAELGWVDGRNVRIEYRWADGDIKRAAEIARELVSIPVNLIATNGDAYVIAIKNATATIPVVFASAGDPVGNGLIESLARPGRNVTGVSMQLTETVGKRIELLREVVPNLRRLAIMFNASDELIHQELNASEAAARTLRLDIIRSEIRPGEDIALAIEPLKGQADALYVCIEPFVYSNGSRINALAMAARLPVMHGVREITQAGGLISYGPNFPDMSRRAAEMADKILRGAQPADIPVEQPTKFDLVINLKTAKALGIDIPATLLARADEVIE
jgi:ABC-type uncharacterized transport system substrate-binding protein